MTDPLRIDRDGAVARVTMARPEVHNAFNEELIAGLQDAFSGLSSDDGVRVVVLAGDGHSFSAGADLDWMKRMGDASDAENRQDALKLAAMLRTVAECPKPVVADVHGNAFGGGVGLIACADIAVASEGARFGFTEAKLGLAPATIAPWVMRKVNPGRVLPLFLTGDWFDAQFALSIGLLDQVVDAPSLDDVVDGVISALLGAGPQAQAACKRLFSRIRGADASLDEYTAELIASLRTSEEGREGVIAFLEKRKPAWQTNRS